MIIDDHESQFKGISLSFVTLLVSHINMNNMFINMNKDQPGRSSCIKATGTAVFSIPYFYSCQS